MVVVTAPTRDLVLGAGEGPPLQIEGPLLALRRVVRWGLEGLKCPSFFVVKAFSLLESGHINSGARSSALYMYIYIEREVAAP